jgi:hypothetical protein
MRLETSSFKPARRQLQRKTIEKHLRASLR